MLTTDQKAAVEQVAAKLGWDRMTLADFEKVAWCAFHYLAMRFRDERGVASQERKARRAVLARRTIRYSA